MNSARSTARTPHWPVCRSTLPARPAAATGRGSYSAWRVTGLTAAAVLAVLGAAAAMAWPNLTLVGMKARAALGTPAPAAPPQAPRQAQLPVPAPEPQREVLIATAAATPVPAPVGVSRDASGWVLQAQGMVRGQLIEQLAAQSGTVLKAPPGLLQATARVNLQFRHLSLAQAWQAVLGDDFSHALMCTGRQCQVWITGTLGHRAPRPAAAGPQTAAAGGHAVHGADGAPPVFTSDPPGLFPSEAAQP